MTSYDQIKRGITLYINRELAPVAPKVLGIGLSAFGPVVVESKLKQFFDSGLLDGTGLVEGMSINLEEALSLLRPATNGKWPIELFGFTFTESDLDKLYRYIKEA